MINMDILEKFENYIKKRINAIKIEISPIDEYLKIVDAADFVLNNIDFIIDDSFDIESIENIDRLFEVVKTNHQDLKKSFIERVTFLKDPRKNNLMSSEIALYVQNELNAILKSLKETRDEYNGKFVNKSKFYNDRKRALREYQRYDGIVENGKIARPFDIDEYKEICDFINETTLDPEEKFELIELFSVYAIEYHEKKRKIELSKSGVEVSKNVKRVEQNLAKETKQKEPKKAAPAKELTEEEKYLVVKIEQIMKSLQAEGIIPDEASASLLSGDYKLEMRELVYYSDDNVKEALYGDLYYNLYPSISTEHNKDLLKLFKYILEVYNKEISKEPAIDIQFVAFTQEETEEFENLYDEIVELIQTIDDYIKNNLTLEDEIYESLVEFKRFVKANDDFSYLLSNANDIFSDIPSKEISEYLNDEAKNLRKLKEKIVETKDYVNKFLDEFELESSEEIEEELDFSDELEKNAWLVHLKNPKTGELYGKEDILKLTDEDKKYYPAIAKAFKMAYAVNLTSRHESFLNKKILNKRNGRGTENMHPHRMRSGEIRIGYCELSINKENQDILSRALEAEGKHFNAIVVLGVFAKKTSDNALYKILNKRIEKNSEEIKKIEGILNSDLNNSENLEMALNLIETGYGIYNDVISKYQEIKKVEKQGGE